MGLMIRPKTKRKSFMLSNNSCSPDADDGSRITSSAYTWDDIHLPDLSLWPAADADECRWS